MSAHWSSWERSGETDRARYEHLWMQHGIFGNVCYRFSQISSFVWPFPQMGLQLLADQPKSFDARFGCCQFDLVFGLRIFSPKKYCARSLRIGQRNPIKISFSSATRAQLRMDLPPTWDQLFSFRSPWKHTACAITPSLRPTWKEYQQIRSDSWLALQAMQRNSSGKIGIVVRSVSDQQLRQFQHCPLQTQRKFGTFEDSVTIKTNVFGCVLDQLPAQ